MWQTKEWWPVSALTLTIFRPSLFGFALMLNAYQFDIQLGFFGLNVDFHSTRRWILKKFGK